MTTLATPHPAIMSGGTMDVPTWVWLATLGVAAAVLTFDVVMIKRNPHVPSNKEVGTILAVYITAAVLFGVGLWFLEGGQLAGEFYAGWLTAASCVATAIRAICRSSARRSSRSSALLK